MGSREWKLKVLVDLREGNNVQDERPFKLLKIKTKIRPDFNFVSSVSPFVDLRALISPGATTACSYQEARRWYTQGVIEVAFFPGQNGIQ